MKINFGFSIAELLQRNDKLLIVIKRDAEQFKGYGSGNELPEKMATLGSSLKEMPSNDYYEGEQKLLTNQKAEIRLALENDINDLRNRVRLTYGSKSVEYDIFRFGRIHQLSDNELVQHALHVVKTAEPRLDKLSGRQVTQSLLDSILGNRTLLDDIIDKQSIAMSLRSEKSLERKTLANELYGLISEACDIGKLIWQEKKRSLLHRLCHLWFVEINS
ncbi:hypothetical protein [Carboxylicivirga linearis]|uniref:Uncharacterized protein n=1 Tax=Carboxylicivirga linearis TaxID=1628157 RepID=A0ABS5JP45_9BACT|nr:hypothetical protein [Carboxylicivirga linearis]MBS2096635.1 hypothetical protein [Carboxylicivirga linearis]